MQRALWRPRRRGQSRCPWQISPGEGLGLVEDEEGMDRRKKESSFYPLQLYFKDESAVSWDTVGDPLGPVCQVGGDDDESVTGFLHSQHSFLPALVPMAAGDRKTRT